MNDETTLMIIGSIIFFLICIMFYGCFDWLECSTKARAIGFKCNYGIIQGCVIIKPNGQRVLLEQMRDMQ